MFDKDDDDRGRSIKYLTWRLVYIARAHLREFSKGIAGTAQVKD